MATNTAPSASDSASFASFIELDLPSDTATNLPAASDASDTMRIPAAGAFAIANDADDVISTECANLVEAERAIANAYGFQHDDGKLLFAPGTRLYDIGVQNALSEARAFAKLPTLAVAAEHHSDVIAAENRRDHIIKLRDWRIDDKGMFGHVEGDPDKRASVPLPAWNQLASCQRTIEVGPDDAPEFSAAKIRARGAIRANVNSWIGQTSCSRKARVRDYGSGREMFALVTPKYTVLDSHDVLRTIRDVMGGGIKCDAHYNATSTQLRADIFTMAPVDIPAFVGVGRIHKVGITLRTGDSGNDSIDAQAFIVRARCRNFTTVREDIGSFRHKHIGKLDELIEGIRGLVGRMPEMISELTDLWGRAAMEHYLDAQSGAALTIPEAITRMVRNHLLPIGERSEDEAIAAFVAAHRVEPEITHAAGVLSAITRASRESWRTKWSDDDTADALEHAASSALYQSVYTLARPVESAEN